MARLHPDRAKLRLQRLKDLEEYQRDYYARKHRKPPTPILPKQEEKVRAKLEKAAVQPLTRKERLAPFHQLYKKYAKEHPKPQAPGTVGPEQYLRRGELVDKAAILANMLGSIDDVSEVLDTGVDILDKYVSGGQLNIYEGAEVDRGYSDLILSRDLQDEFGIDIKEVERLGKFLTGAIDVIEDVNYQNDFRRAVANGEIDLELGVRHARQLMANLSPSQNYRLFQGYNEDGISPASKAACRKFNWNEAFEAFELDDYGFGDVQESEFWAWFRELFYS